MWSLFPILFPLLLAPAPGAPPQAVDARQLFATAEIAPTDVTMYLHIEDAAAVRRHLADRPVGEWLTQIVDESQFGASLGRLARAAGLTRARLFDRLLGRQCTLLSRRDEPRAQWAILSVVGRDDAANLCRQLNAKVHAGRSGFTVEELVEQEILLAHGSNILVIGPKRSRTLFDEVLDRIDDPTPPCLARDPAIERAGALGSGCAGLYLRHAPPIGGWSVAVASLRGDELSIRHHGSFDAAPFTRTRTRLTINLSPLAAFEKTALAAMIEPQDIGPGRFERFIEAQAGQPLLREDLRRALGPRRILVMGETDGRQRAEPVDLLQPAFAVCLEVKHGAMNLEQTDRAVLHLARTVELAMPGILDGPVPKWIAFPDATPRHLSLAPSKEFFAGAYPLLEQMSLNWTLTESPNGCFCVVATSGDLLDETVHALQTASRQVRSSGRFDHAGFAHGARVARHLWSVGAQAPLFAPSDAPPEAIADFQHMLETIGDLAAGTKQWQWKLKRPSANEVDLDVRITLSPRKSADRE